ncbi:MAG: hypothetical protein Q4G30_06925 [Actinomycetaceae bacterium]|nr:hypothetical protein [Actinomycetaceae bacterium]
MLKMQALFQNIMLELSHRVHFRSLWVVGFVLMLSLSLGSCGLPPIPPPEDRRIEAVLSDWGLVVPDDYALIETFDFRGPHWFDRAPVFYVLEFQNTVKDIHLAKDVPEGVFDQTPFIEPERTRRLTNLCDVLQRIAAEKPTLRKLEREKTPLIWEYCFNPPKFSYGIHARTYTPQYAPQSELFVFVREDEKEVLIVEEQQGGENPNIRKAQ